MPSGSSHSPSLLDSPRWSDAGARPHRYHPDRVLAGRGHQLPSAICGRFGDLTQITTANLAARYHDPLTVGVGAVLGLWAVGALAITGGQQLLRLIPLTWIVRIAAAIMTILAVASLLNSITG
jgi:hypothetical protein